MNFAGVIFSKYRNFEGIIFAINYLSTRSLPSNLYSHECLEFSQSQGSLTVNPVLLSAILLLDPHSGASIPPETMMHFPPCFRFPPLFSKNFRTLKKILKI